jgi:hypothetical protein
MAAIDAAALDRDAAQPEYPLRWRRNADEYWSKVSASIARELELKRRLNTKITRPR